MLAHLNNWFQETVIWKTPERALNVYTRTPRYFVEGYRRLNFINSVRRAGSRSIFYSQKFAQFPFKYEAVKSPEDLVGIFTTPQELMKEPSAHFLCGKPDTVYETTGTSSGKPKRVYFSYREIKDAGRVGAAGLWRMGLRPTDRVASAFDNAFWVSGPTLKASLEVIGAFHAEAGRMDPKDFYARVKPYTPNVLVGDPGWMLRLSQIASELGPWDMKVILVGGENLSETSRKYIESIWRCKVLLTYGQTEAFGMIGVECERQDGYHVNDMDLWVEIVGAKTDGFGELVYTTLRREVMPFIRYRSGDVTRILVEPCGCGLDSPRLMKLKGRVDDIVVTGAGNVAPWMIEPVMGDLALPIEEWQIVLKRNKLKDVIELKMEKIMSVDENGLRHRVLQSLEKHAPGIYQGIHQGLVEFEVSTHPKGSLVSGRKIKRVVDERVFDD